MPRFLGFAVFHQHHFELTVMQVLVVVSLLEPLSLIGGHLHEHLDEGWEKHGLGLSSLTDRSSHLLRQRKNDLDGGRSSAILEGLLLGDLSSDIEKFWSLSLPALWVSTGQLAERLEGGTSLVLILLERLDDDVAGRLC